MGFKVMKFHAIGHLAMDIMMFGVPMVVDTGSNESHHKTTKVAAKLTQKDVKVFEKQTSDRLDDLHVLNLAMEEMNGRPLWHYYSGYYHDDDTDDESKNTQEEENIGKTGGMVMRVFWNEDTQESAFRVLSRMKNRDKVTINSELIDFLWSVQKAVGNIIPEMPILAEHRRNGIMFRGHPNYRGKGIWRDWVMVRWQEGDFPAQIWCFVDLTNIPDGDAVQVGDLKVDKGMYAVVECTTVDVNDEAISDLWIPITTVVNRLSNRGEVLERKYYLADVEAFVGPLCVIPNIGAKPSCKYLMMKSRDKWADDFIQWIRMDHRFDRMEMEEDPLPQPKEQKVVESDGSDYEEVEGEH
ncbi:hypothetical protein HC928_16790 [bacterium]|nr:hypothetical protein [bacterium]